jgi:hypothetical protein
MRLTRHVHRSAGAGWGWVAILAVSLIPLTRTAVHAQSRPPLPSEPVAMEGTMKQFYRGLNVVVVKTMDGVEHVYGFTKDLIVHGGKKPGVDALEGLHDGTTVVVHYSTTGGKASAEEIDVLGLDGLSVAEGVVTRIDRGKKEITIRLANGHTETLQMTSRAVAESRGFADDSGAASVRIIVYYADEAGRKVAHYFKRSS